MKKVLLLLFIFAILSGCSKEMTIFDPEYTVPDMTVYNGVSDSSSFKEIKYQELERCFEEKASGIFYLGYEECVYCQGMIKYLDEIAKKYNVTIYYIDAYSNDKEFLKNGDLSKYVELMSEYLPEDNGKKVAKTPHVFTIINGEVSKSQISASPWTLDNPTDSQIDKLKSKYESMIKPFKEYFN